MRWDGGGPRSGGRGSRSGGNAGGGGGKELVNQGANKSSMLTYADVC